MKLLKSQKTEIFDLIEVNGLSPLQFEIIFIPNNYNSALSITKLLFKGTDYYFTFSFQQEEHYSTFCPGDEKYVEEEHSGDWETQKDAVINWLSYLKREINTPDKWQRLIDESENLKLMKYNEDSIKFNASEYLEIKSKINLLKNGLKEIGIEKEEMKTINSRLDHLEVLMQSMNKIDWKNLFVGTILSIPIQLSLSPDVAKGLFLLVKKVFSAYFLT